MFIIKDYSMAIKLNEVNKILYSYYIKNNVVDENSKEILTQSNNLIYEKTKSHFKINPKDFGLHINNYTNEKDEYLESLEIANIIKERSLNKNESTKMITQDEIFYYLENKIQSSKI
ncbi:hypothetical protein [Aliarcobacter cryaerophilus]|uniref:Uncharacterized protein n=2 Tax=Aliarcobacter cryaerophilus TaxID=28198 RepID=A0AA46S331_9BACT|nr:hypothetical protein [Aliarcobacter cryaerophilus]UYF44453.1 hypothetical protein NGX11_10860 [Aliarcobacter cryaerophilus]